MSAVRNTHSEIGADVAAHFPDAVRVASWAGICPGHHESVGKQRSGRRRDGNQYLEPAAGARTRTRRLIAELEALGHQVTLQPAA